MTLRITLQRNEYRDLVYIRLFNQIQSSRELLEEPVVSRKSLWDSWTAKDIDDMAGKSEYRVYRKNSTVPDVYLIGYEQNSMGKTLSFLEALALQRIFERCTFLVDGYDGSAVMLSRANPVTNLSLNNFYRRYNITPSGNDSFTLREQQYKSLHNVAALRKIVPEDEKKIREKTLEAMDCLVRRERDYFMPGIVEQKEKGKPIIFLANMVHALSDKFPIVLQNNKVKYAFFVPNPL